MTAVYKTDRNMRMPGKYAILLYLRKTRYMTSKTSRNSNNLQFTRWKSSHNTTTACIYTYN
eukprot:GAHX01001522.1.p1 GENE.GAHX01001522.1~~GAHX01001522.1.p1  ORF type:complete len:61 (-),score=3.29 GAHX01001522.1:242-424(-)